MPAPVAVEFDDVWFQWDDHVVLRGISFTVPKGSMRMLLGASGSGKSTILKMILGLIRPDAGHVLVNGEPIDGLAERDLLRVRADIGMLFQPRSHLATTVNDEIVKLRDLEQVTSIIVTHQLRDAFDVATHQAVRKDGRVEM